MILKGANFTGFKLWSKDVMKEREWFDTFNTNKINVRKYHMNKILFIQNEIKTKERMHEC